MINKISGINNKDELPCHRIDGMGGLHAYAQDKEYYQTYRLNIPIKI